MDSSSIYLGCSQLGAGPRSLNANSWRSDWHRCEDGGTEVGIARSDQSIMSALFMAMGNLIRDGKKPSIGFRDHSNEKVVGMPGCAGAENTNDTDTVKRTGVERLCCFCVIRVGARGGVWCVRSQEVSAGTNPEVVWCNARAVAPTQFWSVLV